MYSIIISIIINIIIIYIYINIVFKYTIIFFILSNARQTTTQGADAEDEGKSGGSAL